MALSRITANSIADGTVVAADIADGSITTAKIADGNVSSSKLASSLTISANTGSASAPAIYPTGDTNTGIFFPAADTIAFAEGGAEAMRIDSSRNLLLGTTSHETGAFGSAIGMNINSTRPQMLLRNSATAETGYMGIAGNILYVATANSIPLAFVTSDVERMRIDSSGRVTMPYQPCFRVRVNNASWIQTSPVPFASAAFDVGSNFNTSTYRFTAPIAGKYLFSLVAMIRGESADYISFNLRINGNGTTYIENQNLSGNDNQSASTCVIYDLSANDYVDVGVSLSGADYYGGLGETNFSGYLIG